MGEIEVSVWGLPHVPAEKPRATRDRRKIRSVLTGTGVLAAHILCILLLLRQTALSPDLFERAESPPMMALLIEEPSAMTSESMTPESGAVILAPPLVELAPPELVDVETSDSGTASTTAPTGQFIPPRKADADEALVKFASLAALRPGQMVRIILRVEVLPDGTTGVVAIDTPSGIPTADAAAVEYARALRWSPASYGGVPTAMKVRLPVVFTGTGEPS